MKDQPHNLHYVTHFVDGLKPHVRVLVDVQLPPDLETTYNIALVQEEVSDNPSLLQATTAKRQYNPTRAPHQLEDKRNTDQSKGVEHSRVAEDKL